MRKNEKTGQPLSKIELRKRLRLIGGLSRAGMHDGNRGDFDSALVNINDALSLAREIDKPCLVAKLLNNLGILYAQKGVWDKALLSYEQSVNIVTNHHGTQNCLYKVLQKNISHLLGLK